MRIRTGYSFHCAVGKLEDVASRLSEIGSKVAPMSDRCSTYGFVRWTKVAKASGLRPIYGVELAVVPRLGDSKPIADYWTFFAKSSLRPLHDLIWLATGNEGREPSLKYSEALSATGVIKITGERTLLDRIEGNPPDLFVGLSPSTPKALFSEAKKRGLRFIATGDNVYPRPDDHELYKIAIGWRASSQTYPQHILSDEELRKACWYCDDASFLSAVKNRDSAIASCTAELVKATLLSPPKKKTLKRLCEEGAKRLKVKLSDPVYKERLERELRLIAEKKFEDYFFIIADLMQWSRERMIVGPARGSSCGSLVCYLLGITAVDPIPFNLVFERFIDTTRSDLPDIDLDFSDARRHLAFEYLAKKYGDERSARLGSVGNFAAKLALKAIGTALRIPIGQINEVSNTVIKRSMGDSRAGSTVIDAITETDVGKRLLRDYPNAIIAGRIEGHPSGAGQHAAGMVLTDSPVIDVVAVDARTGSTMCDKKDAESLNLLKIDMLGLTQLSIFERTLELIGEKPLSAYLEALPLNDQAAFDVLNQFKFSGVFQFGTGSALSHLVEGMIKGKSGRLTDIEDIVSLTALVRPGPLGSGMTDTWMRRRTGEEPVTYFHPSLEPYLKTTLGVPIYQENIMQIGREIGDLTWADVTALRQAMSKSLGKEYFDKFGDPWKAGAIKKGWSRSQAAEYWDHMCEFGMWSFNRSHSVAYAIVSYWCLWLKAHYPVEFAAATLDAEKEPARQIAVLREMKEEGIDYKAIDVNLSTDRWIPMTEGNRRVLLGPLTNIKGIGPASLLNILDCRKTGTELKENLRKRLEHAKTELDSLTPVADAVAKLHPNLEDIGIVTKPTAIGEITDDIGTVVVLARITKVAPLNENEPSRVAKRGYAYSGPIDSLNLFVSDDSGELFCKVGRHDFQRIGRDMVEQAKVGRSLYAIKGRVPPDFRMIWVKQVKYLGEMT